MGKYTIFLFDGKELEISADDYSVYKDKEIVKFTKGEQNIAWFSLRSIGGFARSDTT